MTNYWPDSSASTSRWLSESTVSIHTMNPIMESVSTPCIFAPNNKSDFQFHDQFFWSWIHATSLLRGYLLFTVHNSSFVRSQTPLIFSTVTNWWAISRNTQWGLSSPMKRSRCEFGLLSHSCRGVLAIHSSTRSKDASCTTSIGNDNRNNRSISISEASSRHFYRRVILSSLFFLPPFENRLW